MAFFHRTIKLTRNELVTLLKFLGEEPENLFNSIEDPRNQRPGFSSAIRGGTFYVVPTIKGLEFHVTVRHDWFHDSKIPEDRVNQKHNEHIVKVVEFSRGVVHWADKKYS
jgi:hypothetical protein